MAAADTAGLKNVLTEIIEHTIQLSTVIRQHDLKEPNWGPDSPDDYKKLPGDVFMKRQQLIDLLQDMIWLVQGPTESVFALGHGVRPRLPILI